GEPRAAHRPDRVALGDALAGPHADAGQVAVERLIAVGVAQVDRVAEAVGPTGEADQAVGRSADRRAGRPRGVADQVRRDVAQDRVHAAEGEAGADAGEAQGRAQEGLAQGRAVGGVVARPAAALEAHGPQHAAAAVELGREDSPVAGEAPLEVELLY